MRFYAGDIIGTRPSGGRDPNDDVARFRVSQDVRYNDTRILCDLLISRTGSRPIPAEARELNDDWCANAYLVTPSDKRPAPMEDTREYLSVVTGE